MIIDIDGFEIDFDKLINSFGRLFQEMGLDGTDKQQVYNTLTVFIASLLASVFRQEYGDDTEKLKENLPEACKTIAEDLETKIRAFLPE
ncbi:MAG: hypothetical protein AB1393_05100 [Candidatus Edwardsbacteria bacterium]